MSGGGSDGNTEAALLLNTGAGAAATAIGAEMAGSTDLSHVLTGLQQSDTGLSSTLHTHPQVLTDELSMATGVSTDPETLRFDFPLEDAPVPKKKVAPAVYREQDRFLPINNVSRVMRNAIPKTGKVSKDAKECMQECVSEFISFITSEAADRCSQEKRKTLTGDDILFAMATLGFDNYIEPMKLYLQMIRESTKVEKAGPTNKEREKAAQHLSTPPLPTLDLQQHTTKLTHLLEWISAIPQSSL